MSGSTASFTDMESSKILRTIFRNDPALGIAHNGARRANLFKKIYDIVEKQEIGEFEKACRRIELCGTPVRQAGRVVSFI